jgi:predicted extracellular nuclease
LSFPLLAMTEQGQLSNVLSRLPAAERYSFSFGGAAQLIDGLLVSPALVDEVTWVGITHVNADFPSFWETDMTPERLGFRSSDHDFPLMVVTLPEEERATAVMPVSEQTAVTGGGSTAWVATGLLLFLLLVAGTLFVWRRRSAAY